jgi:hypothetical protein
MKYIYHFQYIGLLLLLSANAFAGIGKLGNTNSSDAGNVPMGRDLKNSDEIPTVEVVTKTLTELQPKVIEALQHGTDSPLNKCDRNSTQKNDGIDESSSMETKENEIRTIITNLAVAVEREIMYELTNWENREQTNLSHNDIFNVFKSMKVIRKDILSQRVCTGSSAILSALLKFHYDIDTVPMMDGYHVFLKIDNFFGTGKPLIIDPSIRQFYRIYKMDFQKDEKDERLEIEEEFKFFEKNDIPKIFVGSLEQLEVDLVRWRNLKPDARQKIEHYTSLATRYPWLESDMIKPFIAKLNKRKENGMITNFGELDLGSAQ